MFLPGFRSMMSMMVSRLDSVAICSRTISSAYWMLADSLTCSCLLSISSWLTIMLPILPGDGFVCVIVACAVCTGMGENGVQAAYTPIPGEPLRE